MSPLDALVSIRKSPSLEGSGHDKPGEHGPDLSSYPLGGVQLAQLSAEVLRKSLRSPSGQALTV